MSKYEELLKKSIDFKDLKNKKGNVSGGIHLYFYYKDELHNLYFKKRSVPRWWPKDGVYYKQYVVLEEIK